MMMCVCVCVSSLSSPPSIVPALAIGRLCVGPFAGAEDLPKAIPHRCVRVCVLLKSWRYPRGCRASVETGRNRHSQGAPRRVGLSVVSWGAGMPPAGTSDTNRTCRDCDNNTCVCVCVLYICMVPALGGRRPLSRPGAEDAEAVGRGPL